MHYYNSPEHTVTTNIMNGRQTEARPGEGCWMCLCLWGTEQHMQPNWQQSTCKNKEVTFMEVKQSTNEKCAYAAQKQQIKTPTCVGSHVEVLR